MTANTKNKKSVKLHRTTLTLFKNDIVTAGLADMYAATMGQAWWAAGLHKTPTTFLANFRRLPSNMGYAVGGGLDYLAEWLRRWRFRRADIDFYATITGFNGKRVFRPRYLEDLYRLRFTGDIDAVREGRLVFPQETILLSNAPAWQNEFIEGALLNFISQQSSVMTRVTAMRLAAMGMPLADNALRRGLGFGGHLDAIVAAYKAGISKTSNLLAGRLFGIPVTGTMAHCFVMFFEKQREAFLKFALGCPANAVFLVDTISTKLGIEDAIWVAHELKKRGLKLYGIRLDSGDLAELSIMARKMLNAAGLRDVQIFGTNSLTEEKIEAIINQGGKITLWASGDAIADTPLFGLVWKLSQVMREDGSFRKMIKLSEDMIKVSFPGEVRARRYFDAKGMLIADVMYDEEDEFHPKSMFIPAGGGTSRFRIPTGAGVSSVELLEPLVRNGKITRETPSFDEVRSFIAAQIKTLPKGHKRFINPHRYRVGMTPQLATRRRELFDAAQELAVE